MIRGVAGQQLAPGRGLQRSGRGGCESRGNKTPRVRCSAHSTPLLQNASGGGGLSARQVASEEGGSRARIRDSTG